MNTHKPAQPNSAHFGVSLTEYAMLLGLVSIVSLVSLQTLGGSTYNLFENSSTKLEKQGTLSLLQTPALDNNSQQKSANGQSFNSGPYKLTTDPVSGKIAFQLTNGNQGMATNTTSLDGDQFNTLGTAMIANKFQDLADTETDPELKDYYEKLAKASFYLGAAEGKLDNVEGLVPKDSKYTSADALRDVINLSQEMGSLLNNVPSTLDKNALNEVIPLAAEVYNIAQTYKNGLKDYIAADGQTTKEFETTMTTQKPGGFLTQVAALFGIGNGMTTSIDTITATTGTGEPGSILETVKQTQPGDLQPYYTSYSSLVSYEQLKNKSEAVLAQNNVASVPVESTLVNATVIDATATGTP